MPVRTEDGTITEETIAEIVDVFCQTVEQTYPPIERLASQPVE